MPFGLLPKDLADGGELPINLMSAQDDFAPGVTVDPADIKTTWAASDCVFRHDLPIYNFKTAAADTGAVYELVGSALSFRLPRAIAKQPPNRLLIATVVAGIGAVLAALIWQRRK